MNIQTAWACVLLQSLFFGTKLSFMWAAVKLGWHFVLHVLCLLWELLEREKGTFYINSSASTEYKWKIYVSLSLLLFPISIETDIPYRWCQPFLSRHQLLFIYLKINTLKLIFHKRICPKETSLLSFLTRSKLKQSMCHLKCCSLSSL